jgi:hypothetical protein
MAKNDCQNCGTAILAPEELALRCVRVKSTGLVVWKRMHGTCLSTYIERKTGMEIVLGDERDRLLSAAVVAAERRRAERNSQKSEGKKTGSLFIGKDSEGTKVYELDGRSVRAARGDQRPLRAYLPKSARVDRPRSLGDVSREKLRRN